jgi:hypothetical protein
MVIAPENNLIPYPGHHYQVQPYVQDNRIANQKRHQEPIEGQKFFRRPHSEINADANHFNRPGNLYDFKLFLQSPAFEQIGLVVDIYA